MVLSRKRVPLVPKTTLKLNNQVLEQVDMYKYPGILISKDLFWSPHIDTMCYKILGLLYRRSYQFCSSDALRQLYTSLVRPHLEYACHLWALYTHKNIHVYELKTYRNLLVKWQITNGMVFSM